MQKAVKRSWSLSISPRAAEREREGNGTIPWAASLRLRALGQTLRGLGQTLDFFPSEAAHRGQMIPAPSKNKRATRVLFLHQVNFLH